MSGESSAVEFRVLGPVEASVASRLVTLTGKQRSLLAVLLLNSNRVVSLGALADAIWGRPAPASPDTRVRMLVSELRRALTTAPAGLIETRPPGYVIHTEPGQLDLDTFLEASELARQSAESGHTALSITQYETALALWRGGALGGVTGSFAETEALRLEELRLGVMDARSAGLLSLGRHSELIADLGRLTTEHPLRERSHAHLMVALHHSGRRAEALEVFRSLRERLVDELGLEPSPELRQLQQQILTEEEPDRAAAPRAPAVRPPTRQLPSDMAQFVGRLAEIERLDALSTGSTRLLIIAGAAGAGKTALVVHWAHQAEERYPDGQLFLDMRGFDTGSQVAAAEALPQLLLALGVAVETIPVSLDAQAGLYRSLLAERKMLLVLDNVSSPDQVRPLLPGGSGCLVVVTSRDRLGGLVALDGARRLTLDVLSPSEAHDVLARTVGEARLTSEPEAAADLAQLCGYLPLALRIIAARLADQPHRTLDAHAQELASADRMAFLRIDEDARSSVRGAFDLSYQALPTSARRMFRLLGLVPSPGGLSSAAAAALASVPICEAENLLDRLARLHLVRPVTADRHACHDLLLEFAAELVTEDSCEDNEAAVIRLLNFYLTTVDQAGTLLTSPAVPRLPHEPVAAQPLEITDNEQARRWIDLEWDNLVAGLRHAAATGPRPMAWHLADALDGSSYLFPRISRPEWKSIVETALGAALAENDPRGEAAMRRHLGVIHWHMAEFPEAIEQHGRAAQLFNRSGMPQGELAALRGRGAALAQLGRMWEAIDLFDRALAIGKAVGDLSGQVSSLNNLAAAWVELGEPDRAADYLAEALPLMDADHYTGHDVGVYGTLALIRYEQGRLDEAGEAITQALATARGLGNWRLEAESLVIVGAIHRDAEEYAPAAETFAEVLAIARHNQHPLSEILALNGLASIDIRQGRPAEALERLRTAQHLIARTNYQLGNADNLALLAEAHQQLGNRVDATTHAAGALAAVREFGPFNSSARERASRILEDKSAD